MLVEDPRVIEFDVRTDEMLVNMGPQHPSTHGVLRLVLRTDGEVVSEVEPHIGYLHRCAEKIGENLTHRQWIPYTDRMDYLAAMNMNLGWSLAVEKLMGKRISERGRHLRVIIAELGRIASHLVGMGAYGLDLGSFSPFLYAFRERERILDLFEEACGARLTYSYLTPGGATADLPQGWTDRCLRFLEEFEPNIPDYHTLLTTNAVFVKRTAGIGVMPPEMAIDYGTSGPVLRGSGIDWDLRRDGEAFYTQMYEGYRFRVVCSRDGAYDLPPGAPTPPREAVVGDCWHRFFVRMLEVVESISLVRQAIERYRATDFDEPRDHGTPFKLTQKLPVGDAYLETECPRGQMGFYVVSVGEAIPWRARARSGSFSNLSIMSELSAGSLIADIPAIVGSLDIVMGEIDR
ncbi:MAG: NADH-quinone oxidoreductase subunit D [Lacipirellulaceae bacterium]